MPDFAKSRASRAACTALIAGSVSLSGCLLQKKPARAFVPPPPMAAKVAPTPQELSLPQSDEDFAPEVELTTIVAVISLPPAPVVKPTAPKSNTRPPATAEPVVPPATIATPTPTVPKPIIILSAEERRQYNQEIDSIKESVKKVLDRAGGKSLPSDLAKLADDARTSLQQAEQAREKDLVTAVTFAKRAEFFANDLSKRLP